MGSKRSNHTSKTTHLWLLMGVQRRQKRPQGPIHRFFWAVPSAVRQASAANRRPKTCASHTWKRLPCARRWSTWPVRILLATSMASYGRLSAFKPAVYYCFPSQRHPSQKTGFHRPFDGLFSLSSRHWPHSLCKQGKCKHTLFPSQRHPSRKTGFHRPFDGLFSLSSRHWPHSLCKQGKCKHTLFPSQRHPSRKTGFHRPFDGLFSLSSRHWPHSLCKQGKCKHTLFPSQRHPSRKTGSHRPFDGLFSLSSRLLCWRLQPNPQAGGSAAPGR